MKRGIFYIATICTISSFVFLLFTNSISYNLNTSSYKTIKIFSTISPQGWGFFTKSPREDNVYIYSVTNKNIINEMLPNSHYSNFFGLSRKSRMIGFEISHILVQLNKEKWENFNGNFNKYTKKAIKVDNSKLHYLKTGSYLLVKEKVPPYLWRNYVKNKLKEIIYVECVKK